MTTPDRHIVSRFHGNADHARPRAASRQSDVGARMAASVLAAMAALIIVAMAALHGV